MAIVTVTRQWTDEKGVCEECGDPAAFVVPDAYGPNHKLDKANLRCAICAANAAAYDGERIVGLFFDDGDRPPSPEEQEIIATYPIKDEEDTNMLTIEIRRIEEENGSTEEIYGAPSQARDEEHARQLGQEQANEEGCTVSLYLYTNDDVIHMDDFEPAPKETA